MTNSNVNFWKFFTDSTNSTRSGTSSTIENVISLFVNFYGRASSSLREYRQQNQQRKRWAVEVWKLVYFFSKWLCLPAAKCYRLKFGSIPTVSAQIFGMIWKVKKRVDVSDMCLRNISRTTLLTTKRGYPRLLCPMTSFARLRFRRLA